MYLLRYRDNLLCVRRKSGDVKIFLYIYVYMYDKVSKNMIIYFTLNVK